METYAIEERVLTEQPAAVMTAELSVADIGGWIGPAFGQVAAALGAAGSAPAGMPFARYHMLGDDRFAIEAGFPCTGRFDGDGQVRSTRLPGGPAVATWHVGPYDTMAAAYEAVAGWLSDHGAEPAGDPWEVYYSDPAEEPDPATWRTEVVQPYRTGAGP